MDQDRSGCGIKVLRALRPAPKRAKTASNPWKHAADGRRRNQFSVSFLYLFALNLRNSMNAASSSAPCSGDLNHSETMEASWIGVLCGLRGGKGEFAYRQHLEVFFLRAAGTVGWNPLLPRTSGRKPRTCPAFFSSKSTIRILTSS